MAKKPVAVARESSNSELARIIVSKSQKNLSVVEFQSVCAHQSIIGLFTSVFKFFFHVIAALLKVLFHLIKMLAGEKGEKFIGDATTKAKNLENKTLRNENIRKNYEKTKSAIEERAPIVKAKIEDQIPSMRRSLDVFEKRLDSELPGLKGLIF